jgi:hypothetical protein
MPQGDKQIYGPPDNLLSNVIIVLPTACQTIQNFPLSLFYTTR